MTIATKKNTPANFFISPILLPIIIVFVIRILFSFLPSFLVDMNAWLGWAARLKDFGFSGFYSDTSWTQYTPGFLYWLWFGGKVGWTNEFLVKLPLLICDILTSVVIWKIITPKSKRFAYISFFLYALNPALIFTGSVWGQIDGIFTFFLVLGAYFLISSKKISVSSFFWAIAFLIKPQAIVFLPPAIYISLSNKFKLKDYFYFGLTGALTIFLVSLPFFATDPIFGIFKLVSKMTGYYNFTSLFAFNFWSIVGMWQKDSITYLGVSYYFWGVLIYLLAIFMIFLGLGVKKNNAISYLVFALSFFAAFLFPTRVHERYLFPTFAFLLISTGLSGSLFLGFSYIALSFLNFLNLYHPYAYYSDNYLKSQKLLDITESLTKPIAILSLVMFFAMIKFKAVEKKIFSKIDLSLKFLRFRSNKEVFSKIDIGPKKAKYLLFAVIIFAFATRTFALGYPQKEYFDEVYHAFTARVMLHGDPKAWEWWNTPPQGFAYEWTHPPLAKFGMVLGMTILGENSFGWRFPGAILGTISVYLVYLIAKKIFNDETVGLLSAFVFSLDGIALVTSRIGMNDVYFLCFALASLYFYLKEKSFISAIFLGLSLASKWSAIWLLPVIAATHFVLKRKIKLSYVWFIILPPLIYIASYVPFFIQGHSFQQFFNINVATNCFGKTPCDLAYGVQQQMWWYHTHLKATHAYTSPWWSWPFDARPVYLYTSDTVNNTVSRIYMFGNPIIFWVGLLAVLINLLSAIKNRNKKLGLVIFSYFIFFAAWAASPRIMFLYHYLPSIPFLAIATGYLLRKNLKLIPLVLLISLVSFIYFYPHWAGLNIPESLDASYYWFSSWR